MFLPLPLTLPPWVSSIGKGLFTWCGNGCGNGKKMLPLQLDSTVSNGLVHTVRQQQQQQQCKLMGSDPILAAAAMANCNCYLPLPQVLVWTLSCNCGRKGVAAAAPCERTLSHVTWINLRWCSTVRPLTFGKGVLARMRRLDSSGSVFICTDFLCS